MIKRFLLIFGLFWFGVSVAHSQILISLIFGDKLNSDKLEFGLDGGAVFSGITNLSESKSRTGWHLGFYFDIKLEEKLLLHTGVIVKSTMGARRIPSYMVGNPEIDAVLGQVDVTRKLNYFYVPIFVKYRFYDHFYVEGGPQLGLLSRANDVFTGELLEDDTIEYVHRITSDYKRIDYGVAVGLGYRLIKGKGVNLGVRYYLGLADILKDNTGDPQHNHAIYLAAGIPIGAGKAAAAKEAE